MCSALHALAFDPEAQYAEFKQSGLHADLPAAWRCCPVLLRYLCHT